MGKPWEQRGWEVFSEDMDPEKSGKGTSQTGEVEGVQWTVAKQPRLLFIRMKKLGMSFPHVGQSDLTVAAQAHQSIGSDGHEPVRMGSDALICQDWSLSFRQE